MVDQLNHLYHPNVFLFFLAPYFAWFLLDIFMIYIIYIGTMSAKAKGVSWLTDSLGKSQCQTQEPQGFQAFPHIFFLSSWTSKDVFFSANGLPREYHVQCMSLKVQTLLKLSPHLLVRDIKIMYFIIYFIILVINRPGGARAVVQTPL